jgi:hypothetical protein
VSFPTLLAALGAALEIFGFMLVAVELVRTQRRELGTAGPFQFLVTFTRWTRQVYRKLTGRTITHEGAVELSGTLSVTGRASARLETQSNDPAERLHVLEENFRQLEAELTQHRDELEAKVDKSSNEQREALMALEAKLQAEADTAKKTFEASASLQWWGIGLFVLGAIASAASNIMGSS